MSKRAGPPLFELLRERGESPLKPDAPDRNQPSRSQPGPTSPAQPGQPQPAAPRLADQGAPARSQSNAHEPARASGVVSRAERSAATLQDEPASANEIRLSHTRFYLAIAIAMALVVIAWTAGYKIGQNEATQRLAQSVRDESVVVPPRGGPSNNQQNTSPGTPTGSQPAGGRTGGSTAEPDQNTNSQPSTRPVLESGWVLVADGLRAGDPRVPGTNYLELATLPADQASDAINYLGSRGVRTIGVPVDSGGSAGNNPSRYTLYSLGLAVPSGQYSSTTAERRDHQQLVASIGSDWVRDRRGGSDFSQTLWRKYDP